MLSQAEASRNRPPMTACSASIECGGTGASTAAKESRRALAGPATVFLLFRDDQHRQRHIDVGMQVQSDNVLANRTQGAVRHAHFTTLDLEAGLGGRLSDVASADRAEELAFGTGLRRDAELEVLHRSRALFSARQVLASELLELLTTGFEALDVVRRRKRRLASGQEEVPAIAGTHFYTVADIAEVGDLLKQNYVHC